MKKLSKTLAKGLFVITLFSGISVALSTTGFKTVNEAHAAATYEQVFMYLTCNTYTVVTLYQIPNREDWTAHTICGGMHFTTTVHVKNSSIIGHEDVIL